MKDGHVKNKNRPVYLVKMRTIRNRQTRHLQSDFVLDQRRANFEYSTTDTSNRRHVEPIIHKNQRVSCPNLRNKSQQFRIQQMS